MPTAPREQTKSLTAYHAIRQMVVAGQFQTNHRWSLRKLAQSFEMSVVPVSEAVRRLEQEGILIAHPQRGISQRQLTPHEIKQAQVVREGLEVQAARIVAIRKNESFFKNLEKIASRLIQHVQQEKFSHAVQDDFKFHEELVAFTRCDMLIQMHNQVATICLVCTDAWDIGYFTNQTADHQSHLELVQQLRRGDPEMADAAVRAHIRSSASARPNALKNNQRLRLD